MRSEPRAPRRALQQLSTAEPRAAGGTWELRSLGPSLANASLAVARAHGQSTQKVPARAQPRSATADVHRQRPPHSCYTHDPPASSRSSTTAVHLQLAVLPGVDLARTAPAVKLRNVSAVSTPLRLAHSLQPTAYSHGVCRLSPAACRLPPAACRLSAPNTKTKSACCFSDTRAERWPFVLFLRLRTACPLRAFRVSPCLAAHSELVNTSRPVPRPALMLYYIICGSQGPQRAAGKKEGQQTGRQGNPRNATFRGIGTGATAAVRECMQALSMADADDAEPDPCVQRCNAPSSSEIYSLLTVIVYII